MLPARPGRSDQQQQESISPNLGDCLLAEPCMYPLDDDDGVLLIRLSVVAVAYILGSSAMVFLLSDKLVGGLCPFNLQDTSNEET